MLGVAAGKARGSRLGEGWEDRVGEQLGEKSMASLRCRPEVNAGLSNLRLVMATGGLRGARTGLVLSQVPYRAQPWTIPKIYPMSNSISTRTPVVKYESIIINTIQTLRTMAVRATSKKPVAAGIRYNFLNPFPRKMRFNSEITF